MLTRLLTIGSMRPKKTNDAPCFSNQCMVFFKFFSGKPTNFPYFPTRFSSRCSVNKYPRRYQTLAPTSDPAVVARVASKNPNRPSATLKPVNKRIASLGMGGMITSIPIRNAAPSSPIWLFRLTANSITREDYRVKMPIGGWPHRRGGRLLFPVVGSPRESL